MAEVARYTFDEAPGSTVAQDSDTTDGAAQNGTFQNGATTDGNGSGVFDGEDDYVEIPHDPAFDLDSGSIAITFTQDTASTGNNPWGGNAAQTLFSKDSTGLDDGGHLTIYIKSDGSVGVRHQDTDSSHNFEGGNVTLGQPTSVIYSWGPDGSQLIVDGVVVDSGAEPLTLAGNSEPITIGATQAQSGDGQANNLQGFFDGQIEEVAISGEPAGSSSVPCFTKGTLIATPRGEVPIETLRVGDLVCTLDHGPQPIRWIGSLEVYLGRHAAGEDTLRPIRITAGALGHNLPKRDLLISRQHRMLISSKIAARMFESDKVLGAAIKLTALPGIFIDTRQRHVEYFHMMFDRHQVVFAEGAPSESLYTGVEALKAVSATSRAEILTLFPELATRSQAPTPAFPIPPSRRIKALMERHAKNNKPLLQNLG